MLKRLLEVLKHRERRVRKEMAHTKSRIDAEIRAIDQCAEDKAALDARWRDAARLSGPMRRDAFLDHRGALERCHERMLRLDAQASVHRDALAQLRERLDAQSEALRQNLIRAEKLSYLLESSHGSIGNPNKN